ncbi:hypothetical protein [Shewanella sp. YLB-07]|uniref:hypothetical protein n=1 Tax=Shewanella sp. YLB-07 TaxID=2601268 RepID=UPI00128DDCE4|nr:hypothetical protein [Shewanella sp. YLB-07]MPY24323.1 hypothetical protein [Shewanella sp. YLB-07]
MKSIITASLALVLALSANTAVAGNTNMDSSYISVDIAPICSQQGQITLSFTNVSGQDLLVDPYYMDKSKFDPIYAGLSLYTVIEGPSLNITYKTKPNYEEFDWYVLAAGATVEHTVDFRDYSTKTFDETVQYVPLFSGNNIDIITTQEGKKISLFMNTDDAHESDIFGPECWK